MKPLYISKYLFTVIYEDHKMIPNKSYCKKKKNPLIAKLQVIDDIVMFSA